MLLAIDVGNSNIVIGCIDGGEISHVQDGYRQLEDGVQYAVGIRAFWSLKASGAPG